jgi:hypothetical protein
MRGFHVLGAVRGHAVLSGREMRIAVRNFRGAGRIGRTIEAFGIAGRAGSFHPGVCQRAPALAAVPDGVSTTAGEVSARGGPCARQEETQVPFQEQAVEFGCYRHCPVRFGV